MERRAPAPARPGDAPKAAPKPIDGAGAGAGAGVDGVDGVSSFARCTASL